MAYATALSSPMRSQFEASSGSFYWSQVYNCGPTCATKIACYFLDGWRGIEATRKLAAAQGRPTTYDEQRNMLNKRGVNSTVRLVETLAELRSLNPDGRRPFIIGIEMRRVPASVRGHSFLGWHSLVVMDTTIDGFWVMDPNMPVGSSGLRRFYTNSVMNYAFIGGTRRLVITPYDPKPVPTTTTTSAGVIRGKIQMNQTVTWVNLRATPNGTIIGSARGPAGAAGSGIYRGSKRVFNLNSVFNYYGSDAANEWRKMGDYLNRIYWVQRQFTHLVS